ncbi:MAG: hypothetical protein PHX40_01910 [Bacilli bacterium]|nr:hypothetical protein [Bacilli bacterium]
MNSYDLLSYYEQQFNASVGKDDVGIAANGLKGLFALTSYYNDFFKNNLNLSENIDEFRRSNYIFNKEYNFVDDYGKSHNIKIGSLSDVQINRDQEFTLKNILGESYKKLLSGAAISMSSFTSAATDNAKELIMSRINASTKLAGMHVYMMAIGFTTDEIAEFMTSDTASEVILKSVDNIYFDDSPKSILNTIDEIRKDPEELATIKESQLNVFEQIYKDSREFTALTGLLGINQKRKADT